MKIKTNPKNPTKLGNTFKYKEDKLIPQTFPDHFPVLEQALNKKW